MMTRVSSSSPRSSRSSTSDENAASVGGSRSVLGPFQVLAVGVVALAPLAVVVADPVDVDQADARLDHPPGQQDRLAEDVAAVAVAHRVGLGPDVEGVLRGGRGDQVEGAAVLDLEILRAIRRSRGVVLALAAPRASERRSPRRSGVSSGGSSRTPGE